MTEHSRTHNPPPESENPIGPSEIFAVCIEQAQQVEASAGYETPGTDAHAKKIRKAQALRKAAKCVELVAGKRGGQG